MYPVRTGFPNTRVKPQVFAFSIVFNNFCNKKFVKGRLLHSKVHFILSAREV